MIKTVHNVMKRYIIPHKENDYHPHLFRPITVYIIIFISLILMGIVIYTRIFLTGTVLGVNISSSVLIDMTNASRSEKGELPLTRSVQLSMAASNKASDMIAQKYFAHISPTGEKAWNFIYYTGYNFKFAGENLAINFVNERDLHQAWLNSKTHRENIIDSRFSEIGIAAIEGSYKGDRSVYVVQMLATPAKVTNSTETYSSFDSDSIELAKVISTTSPPHDKVVGSVLGEVVESSTNMRLIESPIITSERQSMVIAENINVEELKAKSTNDTYSKWYERLIYNTESNVRNIYQAVFVLVFITLILCLFRELRYQHYKHFLYGALLLSVLSVFIYLLR